jgi:hypothetical protein
VTAVAGDFNFFAACVLAGVATKFLARFYIAIAGLVGALAFFVLIHFFLLIERK